MARYRGPTCRLCRVEKTKLFLKGSKCLSEKCPVERRPYNPGEHGRARRRIIGYGIQLREKQKLKRYYGMSEKQFRIFFEKAERKRGITGENLLSLLERRLDSVVYLMGFSLSRTQAKQLVIHGHVRVNNRKVNIPSFLVKEGDKITLSEKSLSNENIKAIIEYNKNKEVPEWIEVDREAGEGRIVSLPTREDVTIPVEEHLIVELYSK
ncbi:MAG: 30S ribosomal protein S4 [Candidatus Aminicenantia bacterium]